MWQLVARALEPRAWARACGAARSLYAVRVRIARARLTRVEEFTRRAAEEWPAAGSIFLDLRAWADLPSLDLAWDPAACALRRLVYVLPALECLHVVEYGERALDCEARDAMGADPGDREFASHLARSRRNLAYYAARGRSLLLERLTLPALRVLSLDAVLLEEPLPPTLAGLQHLVLHIDDDDADSRMRGHDRYAIHKNAGILRNIAEGSPELRTLYIEAASLCYIGGYGQLLADCGNLMPCNHLIALALVNVHVGVAVAVPEGCRVATVLPADTVDDLDKWVGGAAGAGLRARTDALVVRGFRDARPALAQHGLAKLTRDLRAARLLTLAELRIVLDAASLPARVQEQMLELGLEFLWEPAEPPGDRDVPDGHPWAAISLRFATSPPHDVRSKLHDLFSKSCQCDVTGEATFGSFNIQCEGGAWRGAAPAGFIPGDLRACACRACLDCLSRAGLPVAAAQGWRREGFDRLHAPLCT